MDDEQTSATESASVESGNETAPEINSVERYRDVGFRVYVGACKAVIRIRVDVADGGKGKTLSFACRSTRLAVDILNDIYAHREQIIQSVLDGTGWKTRFADEAREERTSAELKPIVRNREFRQRQQQDLSVVGQHLKQLRIRYLRPNNKPSSQKRKNDHEAKKPLKSASERWSRRLKELQRASFAERAVVFNQCRPSEHELGKRELFFSDGPVAKPDITKGKDPKWPWVVSHYVPTDSEAVHELRIPCMYAESAVVWRNEQASVIRGIVDEILWRNASEIWRAIEIGQETLFARMPICDEWRTLAGFLRHFGIWNFVDKTAIFIIDSGIGLHPGNCQLGRSESKLKRRFLDDCEQILRYEKLGLCSLEDVDSFSRIDADPDIVVAAMTTLETRTKTLSQSERRKQFSKLLQSLVEEHGSIGPEELVTRFAIRGGMRRMKLEVHGKAMNRPDTYLEQIESMRGPSAEELFALDHEDVEEQADEELAVA
jgi:hypothetical protein